MQSCHLAAVKVCACLRSPVACLGVFALLPFQLAFYVHVYIYIQTYVGWWYSAVPVTFSCLCGSSSRCAVQWISLGCFTCGSLGSSQKICLGWNTAVVSAVSSCSSIRLLQSIRKGFLHALLAPASPILTVHFADEHHTDPRVVFVPSCGSQVMYLLVACGCSWAMPVPSQGRAVL